MVQNCLTVTVSYSCMRQLNTFGFWRRRFSQWNEMAWLQRRTIQYEVGRTGFNKVFWWMDCDWCRIRFPSGGLILLNALAKQKWMVASLFWGGRGPVGGSLLTNILQVSLPPKNASSEASEETELSSCILLCHFQYRNQSHQFQESQLWGLPEKLWRLIYIYSIYTGKNWTSTLDWIWGWPWMALIQSNYSNRIGRPSYSRNSKPLVKTTSTSYVVKETSYIVVAQNCSALRYNKAIWHRPAQETRP